MISVIWKELRENLKWAFPAMLVLGGAEYFGLRGDSQEQAGYYYVGANGITLCNTSFLTVTMFGCAAMGFLLGLIQIIPELKRDRWAALRHLPISRSTLFGSKVLAGLLLYVFAAGLPFLFSIWWTAAPGHFSAPFVPGMIRPGAADMSAGVIYYFAGLLLALHRGGWIGLRCLPLLAAIHVSFFALNTNLCRLAVEATAAMAMPLCIAGWGAMLDASLIGTRPRLSRWAFWLIAFYGICGLGDLTGSFLKTVQISSNSKFIEYLFSDEGVPMIVTSKSNIIVAVNGIDGTPLTGPKFQPSYVVSHRRYFNNVTSHIGSDHGRAPDERWYNYRQTNSYLWPLGIYEYPHREQWFNLVEQRKLVGYRLQTKEPIGRLGWNGFLPLDAQSASYPANVTFGYSEADFGYLWSQEKVSAVLFPKQESIELSLPASGPIYGVQSEWANIEGGGSVNVVAVALASGVAVYDQKGGLIAMLPFHQDIDHWGKVELGMNGTMDRFYLHYAPSDWIDGKTASRMPSYFEELDPKGNVLHTYTLPPLPHFNSPRPWLDYVRDGLKSPAYYFGEMVYRKAGGELGSQRLRKALQKQWTADRSRTVQIALTISIMSLLCSTAVFLWARRIDLSRSQAFAWAGFVLAFNIAGVILFRWASDWPVRVSCPHCSGFRKPEGEACPHCGGDWPSPPENGMEIFNRPTTEASL